MELGNSYQPRNAMGVVMMLARSWKGNSCMYKTLLVALTASALSSGAVTSAPAVRGEPPDAATLSAIKLKFGRLMKLANNHDFKALHGMFWQSPSTLLVAKSAIQSEGN